MSNVLPLGCRAADIKETVIISPFITVAALEKRMSLVENKAQGIFFLKTISGKIGNNSLTFVSTIPSGSLPADVVFFLKDSPAKRYLFLGSFGSLINTAQGAVFYVQKSFSTAPVPDLFVNGQPDNNYQEHLLPPQITQITHTFKGINVLSTRSLAAEMNRQWLKNLQQSGIGGLDLESADFLSAAQINQRLASAVLFAADFPLQQPILQNPTLSRKGAKLIDNFLDTVLENLWIAH